MDIDIEQFNIKDYYTPIQVAEKLGCGRHTVTQWCSRDIIPYIRIGRKYWIHKDTVKELIFNNLDAMAAKAEKALNKRIHGRRSLTKHGK